MAANNLAHFNVGLPPAPGMGAQAPFYFPIVTGMNNNDNPIISPHHIAEYFSGLVFALTDDGNVIGYPDAPAGRWRNEAFPAANNAAAQNGVVVNLPVNAQAGGRRRRHRRATRRRVQRRANTRRRR